MREQSMVGKGPGQRQGTGQRWSAEAGHL